MPMNLNDIIKQLQEKQQCPIDFKLIDTNFNDAVAYAKDSEYDSEIHETEIVFLGIAKPVWIIAYYS